jgi:hypothetical protein
VIAVNERNPLPGRDEHGRLIKGHRLGGRPRGSRNASPVARALEAAGTNEDEARRLLVEQTIAKAKEGDPRALDRLASWLLPRGRPVNVDLFRGTRTAEDRHAAIVGAMGFGAISPTEAVEAGKAVNALAEASEWDETRRLAEAATTEPAALPVCGGATKP